MQTCSSNSDRNGGGEPGVKPCHSALSAFHSGALPTRSWPRRTRGFLLLPTPGVFWPPRRLLHLGHLFSLEEGRGQRAWPEASVSHLRKAGAFLEVPADFSPASPCLELGPTPIPRPAVPRGGGVPLWLRSGAGVPSWGLIPPGIVWWGEPAEAAWYSWAPRGGFRMSFNWTFFTRWLRKYVMLRFS